MSAARVPDLRRRARLLAARSTIVWRARGAWWRVKRVLERTPAGEAPAAVPAARPTEADGRVARGAVLRTEMLARRAAAADAGRGRFAGKSVLFVLPVGARGGGANVVLSEARAMRRMGVDARVLNLTPLRRPFEGAYPDTGVPALFAYPDGVAAAARPFDAVVATTDDSVAWIAPLAGKRRALGYYVQDFEPWFHPEGSFRRRAALASYTLVPGMRLLTKTEWNRAVLKRETGAEARVIGPSYDADLFGLSRPAPPEAPLRVAAMIRPSSPRRAPERTLHVLSRAKSQLGDAVEVLTFGAAGDDPAYVALPRAFPHAHFGILSDAALAGLLGSVHVFADFSDFQAMGLTALEAMACGATAIVPEEGGAVSFAEDESNALFVDARSEERCLSALLRLARERELRAALMAAAPAAAARFCPEACALAALEALFS